MKACTDAKDLLIQIASCQVAKEEFQNPGKHISCSPIIRGQRATSWSNFQVPEPWTGHLASAPLLSLSSNPSISYTEKYPTGGWQVNDVIDFFEDRFEGHWVKAGKQALQLDGSYGNAVRYWSNIRSRAEELLGKSPVPGVDYVLSEVVHCKSISEAGVREALHTCAKRYLGQILELFPATVIVLVGKKALEVWNNVSSVPLAADQKMEGTALTELNGKKRAIIYMPHPAAFTREPKRFSDRMTPLRLAELQDILSEAHG